MSITTQPTLVVNIEDEWFFKDLGARMAQTREERNITQARTKPWLEPALAQHMERISALPKPQQKFVIQMIDMALAQQGR